MDLRDILNYNPLTGILTWKIKVNENLEVGDVAGTTNEDGYITVTYLGRRHKAHRLGWYIFHGVWPVDQLDHVNRNRTDNRLSNLRESTAAENNRNRKSFNYGTHKHGKKWRTEIQVDKKRIRIGLFDSEVEGQLAYKQKVKEIYGTDC